MGGAFIEAIGETQQEVIRVLHRQEKEAEKMGLIDVRARVIEEEWAYTTPAGKEKVAPWGGIVWIHS